ncbi:pollen receptor-like kinase 3 [Malania oleifera]|uniref:pollen receptor-like kinase 3 n=1 Tax=Malania oleifera TaxID=397392 RepID=UPI0025AE788E|nr:pollen receptor-like kinase 3 [Malania oleifera]
MAIAGILPPSFLLSMFLLLSPLTHAIPESDALLQLKKSFANTTALDSWQPGSSPCDEKDQWVGLVCYNSIITGLRLVAMGLSGKIDVSALVEMPWLRTLSFINNSFSGSIPDFNRLGALKAIYLSGNQFSGEIPSDFFVKMTSLKKVWLSNNNFTGEIPSSLSQLPRLIELHLENNQFTGSIPPFAQQKLKSFDVSNNKLEGEIPAVLSIFNVSSFEENPDLCGEKLGKACISAEQQQSSASQISKQEESNKIAAAMMTVSVVILTIMVVAIFLLKRKEEKFDVLGKKKEIKGHFEDSVEVHVSGSSRKEMDTARKGTTGLNHRVSHHGKGNGEALDLVMVNDEKGIFRLADLMKAAAEVLGNGNLGSSYKAVMSNGVAAVVKRMKEMNELGTDGFDAEMRRLGRLRHWNILTPLAYLYKKEEKLLIQEYLPKGSLLYLLHGDRGPSHTDLDWPVRLKILHGIARGLGYLHTELASLDLPHGNLKSSNVLLSCDYEPLLADYGFSPLLSTTQAAQALFAYKSPEALQSHQVSPKCDVYCLGIIILEILSGKFPSQYLNHGKGGTDIVQWARSSISEGREAELFDPEIASSRNSLGEMERLLHIGVACTESNPELRLGMREAIVRIEEIHIEGGQEARRFQLPSLRDGCAEVSVSSQSRASSLQEQQSQLSGRRAGLNSFGDQSGRRSEDSFAFAIS